MKRYDYDVTFEGLLNGKIKRRKRRRPILFAVIIIALLITIALLLGGCTRTGYLYTLEHLDGRVETTRITHTKILVFTETKELSFVTPDGARLGVGWMTIDPQAAVDFAKVVVPPLWKLLSVYFAPLPVPAALGVKP